MIHVVTFGSSTSRPGEVAYELALAVGRTLGRRGVCVVSGGYAGCMGAVSRGAHESGGRVIGITTDIFAQREANDFLHEVRREPDYPARLAALLRAGDLFVCFPGGLGTISEWATAWCLASIGQLGGELWSFREPFAAIAGTIAQRVGQSGTEAELVRWLDDAADFERQFDAWLSRRPQDRRL